MTQALGLLSRLGASAYAQGTTDAVHASFSTNTVLDSFVPDPVAGTLTVPLVSDGQLITGRLTDERGPLFLETAQALMGQAVGLVEDQSAWSLDAAPYTIPATEGGWLIQDEPEGLESGRARSVVFRSRTRREVEIGTGPVGLLVRAGWHGTGSVMSQTVGLTSMGVRTEEYRIEFHYDALDGLRTFLKSPEASGYELALEAALHIFHSGQYTEAELGRLVLTLGGEETTRSTQWKQLRDFSMGALPEKTEIRLASSGTVSGAADAAPMLEILWEPDSEEGILSIVLRRGPKSPVLMPLHENLRAGLWKGGQFFLDYQPQG